MANFGVASKLNFLGFENYIKNGVSSLSLDLTNASIDDVLFEYEKYVKRTSPNYTTSAIRYNMSELCKVFNVDSIMPIQITDIFWSYFVSYLISKGLKYSTIDTYCSVTKASLTWAAKHHCPISETYDEYNVPKYNKKNISLTRDEISHIYHFNFYKTHRSSVWIDTCNRVRDLFVLSCNLGQRYSDMFRICPKHFNDDKTVFKICQQKTGNSATVNLLNDTIDPVATRKILEKYNYYSPYTGTINNFNRKLSEILKVIGEEFAETINLEVKVNGIISKSYVPKYELIASHTARRTYATLWIAANRSEDLVMRCTGHADSKSFRRYICFND